MSAALLCSVGSLVQGSPEEVSGPHTGEAFQSEGLSADLSSSIRDPH